MISFQFSTQIGTFVDGVHGITAELSTNPPISVYQKGIYFGRNTSFLSFPSSQDVVLLGEQFFISVWFNPANESSVLVCYNSQAAMNFYIVIQNLYMILSITINNK